MKEETESQQDGTNEMITKMLEEIFEIYTERDAQYGSRWKRAGEVYADLFPNGVTLNTPQDFQQYQMLTWCISKITRYCASFADGGHRDSAKDLIMYAVFLTLSTAPHEHEDLEKPWTPPVGSDEV